MKGFLRKSAINAVSLYIVSQALSGLQIEGGIPTFILAGAVFSVISFIGRPILTIITLPLNLITLGAFSFIINVALLYLLTIFIPQISISPFTFEGFSFSGFVIPEFSFNLFFAYIACSVLLSVVSSFLTWLTKK